MKKILLTILALCLLGFGGLAYAGSISKSTTIDGSGLRNGLVGHWTFDGDKSRGGANAYALDSSGNNKTATGVGTPLATAGKIGQGMKFSGSSEMTISLQTMSANGSSISGWFNSKTPHNGMVVASTGSVYPLYFATTVSYFSTSGGGVDLGYTPQFDGKWHHFVVVRINPNSVQLYIDGVGKGVKATVNTNDSQFDELGAAGAAIYFNGSLDDIRFYSRALSASEIQQLYSMGGSKIDSSISQGGLNSGLITWLTMDGQDCGATYCKNKNVGGTLTKSSSFGFGVGKIGQGLNINNVVANPMVVAATNGKSFFAWVNPKVSGDAQNFQGIFNVYTLYYGTSNQLKYFDGSNTWSSTGTIPPNKWSHVGITYDSATQITFWINGVASGSRTVASLQTPASIGFYAYVAAAGNMFTGAMDDVRIYNRVLSPTEISQLYSLGGGKIASSPPSITNGLVGWWTFDGQDSKGGSGGYALDKSGQGNTASAVGAPLATVGKIGQAFKFGTTSDFASFASTNYGTTNTISVWAKKSITTTAGGLFGSSVTDYVLFWDGAGTFYYYSVGSGNYVSFAYTLDKNWHHYAVARNGLAISLYIDGVFKETENLANGLNNALTITKIGSLGGSSPWVGSIDDARIYNRALSATEIQQLYQLGK